MPTLLQLSIEVNSGSVGRIAEQIGQTAIKNGWNSYITYARNHLPSQSHTIKIGSLLDLYWHGINTRIFDNHCLKSTIATKKLIKQIEKIQPDIIHLHHIHGYFINMKILFNYLSNINKPIVWTFHDCWSFTGHCAHYDYVQCFKWKEGCYDCPQKKEYPASYIFDRSKKNYIQKKYLFTSVKNMTIVPVSNWLKGNVSQSFLKNYPIEVIQNGIDINMFSPKNTFPNILKGYNLSNKLLLLGVASTWERRKGLNDFIKLSEMLNHHYQIILVGLSNEQIKDLPKQIIGIERTESVTQLAELYSCADVFLNPTWEDTFPTTNLEALACGTPVITYETGGSVESVSEDTGFIIKKGDISELKNKIDIVKQRNKSNYSDHCRKRAELLYNKEICFEKYLKLYTQIMNC